MCVVEGDLKGEGHSDCVRVLVEGDPVSPPTWAEILESE